jgi:DNA-binding transcriptional MocR family regulator
MDTVKAWRFRRNGIRQTRMAKLEELPAARRKPNHEMRISFGSASEKDIREGIKRLGKVLRRFL